MSDAYRVKLAAVKSHSEATELLADEVRKLGFSDFNYGCLNHTGSMTSTMPVEWIAHYTSEGYFKSDRLVVAAQRRVSPFAVHDIFAGPPSTVREAEMRSAISGHFHGLVVPIHCPEVGFSIAAFFTQLDRDEFIRREPALRGPLVAMALDYHDAVKRFYVGTSPMDGRKPLSRRERQVLELVAKGKTSSDISALTGLAEVSVNNHIYRICRKLKVSNRTQAIAVALSTGQIGKVDLLAG